MNIISSYSLYQKPKATIASKQKSNESQAHFGGKIIDGKSTTRADSSSASGSTSKRPSLAQQPYTNNKYNRVDYRYAGPKDPAEIERRRAAREREEIRQRDFPVTIVK